MAKTKSAYVCNECGADFPRWMGQCTACGAWNSIGEVRVAALGRRSGERSDVALAEVVGRVVESVSAGV